MEWVAIGVAVAATASLYSPLGPVTAQAAEFWPEENPPETDIYSMVNMRGEIIEGDNERLKSALQQVTASGRRPILLRLNSEGGNVYEGWLMASTIQQYGLGTLVGNGDVCNSMCVLMFAAGSARAVNPNGTVGVHSIITIMDNGREEDEGAKAASLDVARSYKDFGVPDAITGKMVTTPPDGMTYLTRADLAGWASDSIDNQVWATVMERTKAAQVENIDLQPTTPVNNDLNPEMTCWNSKGVAYSVVWYQDDTVSFADGKYHKVTEYHELKAGWEANGKRGKGTFKAIFGGPYPHVQFDTSTKSVTNNCQSVK